MDGALSREEMLDHLDSDQARHFVRRRCWAQGVSPADIDCVVGDVLTRARRTVVAAEPYRPIDNPEAWLTTVTYRVVVDWCRSPDQPEPYGLEPPRDSAECFADPYEYSTLLGHLDRLLDAGDSEVLPPFVEYLQDTGTTQADLARTLGKPAGNMSRFLRGWRSRVKNALLVWAYLREPGRCTSMAAFRHRELSARLRGEILDHIDGCATCQERRAPMLRRAALMAKALPAGMFQPLGSRIWPRHKYALTASVAGLALPALLLLPTRHEPHVLAVPRPGHMETTEQPASPAIPPQTTRRWPVPVAAPATITKATPTTAPTTTATTTTTTVPPTTTTNQTQDQPISITNPSIESREITTKCGRCGRDVPKATAFTVTVSAPDGSTVMQVLSVRGQVTRQPMTNPRGTSAWIGAVGPYSGDYAGSSVSVTVEVVGSDGVVLASAPVGSVDIVTCRSH